MKYNPLKHHRRSIRLKGYDYSQVGMYFITLCCNNKESLFGKIINGEMVLSPVGKIAGNEWVNTLKVRSNVELDEFVIMPNHMHGIIIINDNAGPNEIMLGDVVDYDGRAVLHTAQNDNTADDAASNNNTIDNTDPNNNTCNNEIMDKSSSIKSVNANTNGIHKNQLQSPSQTVGAIIRGYKSSVTRQINKLPFNNNDGIKLGVINNSYKGVCNTPQLVSNKIVWQANYYEIIIRNDIAYQNISNYIKNNPSKWMGDKFYTHLNK